MKNKELQEYLQTQITQSPKKLSGLLKDIQGETLFKRSVFLVLQKYLKGFLTNRNDPRIVVMPGLRGTGKTTLLAQLFFPLSNANTEKLYLSIDEIVKRFNVDLWQVIDIAISKQNVRFGI